MSMMKKLAIVAIVILVYGSVRAQQLGIMSLDSCLRYAYQHNLTVKNAMLNTDLAEVNYNKSRFSFTPSLNASASETFSFENGASANGNYGISGNWTLFSGGSRLLYVNRSMAGIAQSEYQLQQSWNNIASQIIQAYLTILMNRERLGYQQEVLKTTAEQKGEGELKYKVGRILESDYQLLEANYESAVTEIANTELVIASNMLSLRTLLAAPDSMLFDVIGANDSLLSSSYSLLPLETVLRGSAAHMPDYFLNSLNVKMAEYDVAIAKSAYLPSLSMNAGASYYGGNSGAVDANGNIVTTNGINPNIGLSLNIPIFNQGATKTQVVQSKINLRQAQIQQEQNSYELNQMVTEQYYQAQQALNTFAASERMKDAYANSYSVYVTKFKAGAVTAVDMLLQQNQYLNALNTYLQNKYSFIMASKILDIYMGHEISL